MTGGAAGGIGVDIQGSTHLSCNVRGLTFVPPHFNAMLMATSIEQQCCGGLLC